MIIKVSKPTTTNPPGGLVGDGTVTIHWHTDGNEGLGPDPIIGSLSIGATRDFAFLGPTRDVLFEKGGTQCIGILKIAPKAERARGESW